MPDAQRPDGSAGAGAPGAGPAARIDEIAEAIVALEENDLRLQGLERFRRTFISEASHELNTPLTPLRIHVEALSEMTDLAQHHRQHLAVIQRNVKRLSSLVGGMLEASRLETGRFRLDLDEAPIALLLTDAVDGLADAAGMAQVALALGRVEHLVVRADRDRVGQVLHNLVSNALRFTPPGGRVTVEAGLAGTQVIVRVVDGGPGLSPQQIGQLFQPFSRPLELPTAAKGTGLGLYLSKGIVEQHGGRAWAESDGPGHGSSFCFSLPLATDDGPAPVRPPVQHAAAPAAPSERGRQAKTGSGQLARTRLG